MLRWSLLLFGLVAVAGTAMACEGLSPGDQIQVGDSLCTLGFLVADPQGLYFTTAGHCIDNDETASTPGIGEWGVGVFHFLDPETGSDSDGSPGNDFALIRVLPERYADLNPKVCGWDGPTGIYNETPGAGGVAWYGHGLLIGEITPRREGYALYNEGQAFYWLGAGMKGDSGGAVLAEDGRALGVLTHLTIGTAGNNGGTHLERGFELAAEAGFTDLRLVLAGEDPLQVLAQLRGPQPVAVEPSPPSSGGSPPPATNSSAPPTSSAPRPSGVPPPAANDSIAPAAADGDLSDDVEDGNRVPFPGILALVAIAAALAFRRSKPQG